jgi:rubrerythrin
MPESESTPKPVVSSPQPQAQRANTSDAVICERCGAEMFRMHAVWRCPSCRYKTDCCGW